MKIIDRICRAIVKRGAPPENVTYLNVTPVVEAQAVLQTLKKYELRNGRRRAS